MKQTKPATSKVVPFTGEFYPELPQPAQVPVNNTSAYLIMIVSALLAGLAIGAITTYQSADQQALRQMQAESAQLQKVKNQVCK